MISAERPQLLCELLDEIGRKDLTSLVKDYIHRRSSELVVAVSQSVIVETETSVYSKQPSPTSCSG